MQLLPDTLISAVCTACYEGYVEPGETRCLDCLAASRCDWCERPSAEPLRPVYGDEADPTDPTYAVCDDCHRLLVTAAGDIATDEADAPY